MLALHTELAEEVAFFESSSSSFFIGSLSQAPAMEELCTSQLCSEQLSGKESEKHLDLPELESALLSTQSLQSDELVAAYSRDSLQHHSLQHEGACTNSFLRTDQLSRRKSLQAA